MHGDPVWSRMSDYRELSELPRDDAYWRDLEARVLDRLPSVATQEAGTISWMQPLAKRAAGLGWLAAAGLATLLLVSGRPDHGGAGLPFLTWPDEPLADAFLAGSPPALASLLITASAEAR